jgi:threonine synthase
MDYFSTNRKSSPASFREAVLNGQPLDGGLFFPSSIPGLSPDLKANLNDRSNPDIAFAVIKPYVDDSIPDEKLQEICIETVDFDFPLIELSDRISALELFHGPTLAFKDVGARFMSRCLRHFSAERNEKTMVVVATSGDTGGAVAAGFHGIEGVDVVILYPSGKVSPVQELQLTTLGGNVTALEVDGTFDECQALAKKALGDADLRERAHLTSANSINVARWLPQQFYYFFAVKQWDSNASVVSVPSGNFGNLAAGLLAQASGLPIGKFIAACNANDVVPEFMRTGDYVSKPSVATLSNAMDVGDPSNFVRILEIFSNDIARLQQTVEAVSISDETTAATMRQVHGQTGYVLDPHGAVAYRALADHLEARPGERGIFLETAHPVKFDSVETILGEKIEPPNSVRELFGKKNEAIKMDVNYNHLKDLLLAKI